MARELITAEDTGDPDSPLNGAYTLTDEDRVVIAAVYDSREDLDMVKSLRLPASLYRLAQKRNHPQGFSGVVRDALQEYLEEPSLDEIQHALTVINTAFRQSKAA